MTTAPTFPKLVAEVRELEPGFDPLGQFDPNGFAWLHRDTAMVASGVAARVAVDDVAAALASVEVDASVAPGVPGTGPVAVGALPFDPEASGELVIPALVVTRAERTYVTRVAPVSARAVPAAPPTRFVVAAPRTPAQWTAMVERDSLRASG